eukprot:TRINITY_DN8378_c0_g2_i1.p1 TRINITY_DN8378_c0_g2~~TRINITY_DN8378_c0_g2_i1.p1  ORF type:complete len:412 (-),score=84.42 TRINITY_DN8378_c0_g2_i1:69-1220(-)
MATAAFSSAWPGAMCSPPQSSPLASPALSASSARGPKRHRCNSDEEALFLLEREEADGIRAAIEASIGPDMKRRVKGSLQETLVDIQSEYPEEVNAQDFHGARRRASTDLTEMAERYSTPGSAVPYASPVLAASMPPIALPPAHEGAVFSPSDFVEHDGLLDHEQLMEAIYRSQGLDFSAVQSRANEFLREIGLRPHDLGVKNTDETGRVLLNQCFYLSIARSYLGHDVTQEQVSSLALGLKRAIETAVLAVRPGWAVGEDEVDNGTMAFADFLPIAMRKDADVGKKSDHNKSDEPTADIMGSLAVCVLDSVQGHVEVFLGPRYEEQADREAKVRNLILLWYTPGHYQCLVHDDDVGSKVQMSYPEFKDILTKHGVMYIETTE